MSSDAFGNAIGNSIVSKLQTSATVSNNKKTSSKVYEQAIAVGKSPKEATFLAAQAVAQENGGAIELGNSSTGGPTGKGSFSYDDANGFWEPVTDLCKYLSLTLRLRKLFT